MDIFYQIKQMYLGDIYNTMGSLSLGIQGDFNAIPYQKLLIAISRLSITSYGIYYIFKNRNTLINNIV